MCPHTPVMAADPRGDKPSLSPALRLAGDERERAIAHLSDAYARDVLPMDEFEQRLDAVYRASTRDDLALLTRDLPAMASDARGVGRSGSDSSTTNSLKISSFLSNVERAGFTAVPPLLEITARLGNVELDLRDADFADGVTEISIHATFGNVEILLPSHVVVENSARAVLGSVEYLRAPRGERLPNQVPALGQPVSIVRITGRALLSSVSVSHHPETS